MRRSATMITLALMLAGCTPAIQDTIARETAKTVVNPIIAARFPGVPVTPITDCVIDNATAGEIITLADGAVNGVTAETERTTIEILNRRSTIECMGTSGVDGVIAGLGL